MFEPNSPVTLQFDYVKNGVVSHRVVHVESSVFQLSKKGKAYFKGETLFVDGVPPSHKHSTYSLENIVENSIKPYGE